MEVRRGEVYWVDFGEVRGKEMAGKHPALVLSINSLNRLAFLYVVVPGTSANNVANSYPTDVLVVPADSGLPHDTVFKCQRLVAIDPKRLLGGSVAVVSDGVMQRVDQAVAYVLGMGISP